MGDRCQKLEKLLRKHDYFNPYKKVKEIKNLKKGTIYTTLVNDVISKTREALFGFQIILTDVWTNAKTYSYVLWIMKKRPNKTYKNATNVETRQHRP